MSAPPLDGRIDLSGEVALVTGGSRGIGAATCLALAAAGARVIVNYRERRPQAEAIAAKIGGQGGVALAVQADLSQEADLERLFASAAALGPLSIVVANAGIWEGAPIAETTLASWRRGIAHNLDSVFLTCRAAAREMLARRRGSIIVVSSTAGQRGEAGFAAYAAAKGAVISLVKSLAVELGPSGIRVNAVAPGWVETDMSRDAIEAARTAITAAIPLGRVAEPEDIAGPILFLASPLSRHVTGEILNVNGGSVLCG